VEAFMTEQLARSNSGRSDLADGHGLDATVLNRFAEEVRKDLG
jgi:hypothetical protein